MRIPDTILRGCCAMLALYAPHMTPARLQAAIAAAPSPESPSCAYLTTRQVCDMLHISKPTVWRHVKSGSLKMRKVGARSLFKESEVRGLVEGRAEA